MMTTVAILPITDANGETFYCAIAGDTHSDGKTAGQALNALTAQLSTVDFTGFLILQSFQPDPFFTAEQQTRLAELMHQWRFARDHNQKLPPEEQSELDHLVELELQAATARTTASVPLLFMRTSNYDVAQTKQTTISATDILKKLD